MTTTRSDTGAPSATVEPTSPPKAAAKIPRWFWSKILLTLLIFVPVIAWTAVHLHRNQSPWQIVLTISSNVSSRHGSRTWGMMDSAMAAFSPDDSKVAVWRGENIVEVWDIDSGSRLHKLETLVPVMKYYHQEDGRFIEHGTGRPVEGRMFVSRLCWSPRGDFIAAWRRIDIAAEARRVAPPVPRPKAEPGTGRVSLIRTQQWRPSSTMVSSVVVWQASDGKRLWEDEVMDLAEGGGAPALAFSPDGERLAYSYPNMGPDEAVHTPTILINIADAETGDVLHQLESARFARGPALWSAQGQYLATCSEDLFDSWDVETQRRVRHVCALEGAYVSYRASPEREEDWAVGPYEHMAISLLANDTAVVTYKREGWLDHRGDPAEEYPRAVLPPVTPDSDSPPHVPLGRVRAFDLATGDLLWDRALTERPLAAGVSPDGKWLATFAQGDNNFFVRDMETWDVIVARDRNKGLKVGMGGLLWFPDSRRVLTNAGFYTPASMNGLFVLDAQTGRRLAVLPLPDRDQGIVNAQISGDGNRIVGASIDRTYYVWQRLREEKPYGILARWELWTMVGLTVAMLWTMLIIARRTARRAGKASLPVLLTVCLFLWAGSLAYNIVERIAELVTAGVFPGKLSVGDYFASLDKPLGILALVMVTLLMVIHLRRGWRVFATVLCIIGWWMALAAHGSSAVAALMGRVAWSQPVDYDLFSVPVGTTSGMLLLWSGVGLAISILTFVLLKRKATRKLFTVPRARPSLSPSRPVNFSQ